MNPGVTLESFQSVYPRLGSDEVGKGDFFGPLVVAAVIVERQGQLPDTIADSKRLSAGAVERLADELKPKVRHAVVKILPPRYNELYGMFRNINAILGWAHAQAIRNLLAGGAQPAAILIDQFGPEFRVRRHLEGVGKDQIHFFHRAERDAAVALASVIARQVFVREIERLSAKAGMKLPLGAGEEVDAAARLLARKIGKERMTEFVKVHFKNFARI